MNKPADVMTSFEIAVSTSAMHYFRGDERDPGTTDSVFTVARSPYVQLQEVLRSGQCLARCWNAQADQQNFASDRQHSSAINLQVARVYIVHP